MKKSPVWVLMFMIVGIAVLCSLGVWQLNRLAWKQSLVERVENRLHLEPVPLEEIVEKAESGADFEYQRVSARGVFDHAGEVYYFTTHKGAAGWNVYTPLILENGKILIVNRGFVEYAMRDPQTRLQGQLEGQQELSGLARATLNEQPNSFVPDNNLDRREFYWKSHSQMAGLMSKADLNSFIPFFVDADEAPVPGGWPKGGATIISFPNNHLQYALTWFGLALALLGVGSYFLYARRGRA